MIIDNAIQWEIEKRRDDQKRLWRRPTWSIMKCIMIMIHLIMIDDDGLIVQTYNSSKVQNQSESESQTQANKMEEIFKMNGKAT